MKKLKLSMDDLAIESFETVEGFRAFSGTVNARNTDEYSACAAEGCESYLGCGDYSLRADPWGCTVGDTCDNCGPTNMEDCSWGGCTFGTDDTCRECESVENCASRGVC